MSKVANVKKIDSSKLSALTATAKDFINMGEWFLYGISYKEKPKAEYYLSTDHVSYYLSKNGSVLDKTEKTPDDLKFDSQIKFKDIADHTDTAICNKWLEKSFSYI